MKKKFFLCFISLFTYLFVLFFQLQTQRPQFSKNYLKPPQGLEHFLLGYHDAFASLLWIRTLQNFDYCENGKYQESDYTHPVKEAKNKLQGILFRKLKPSKCHKGWVFHMLYAISQIQPKFKIIYSTGAPFLSVAVDDREGARLLFDKGLSLYPEDWRLSYAAGYHYLWEIQDPQKAAQLLQQSLKSGGPPFLASLSAALYSEAGQKQYALAILKENLEKNPPPDVRQRILHRIKEIQEEMR